MSLDLVHWPTRWRRIPLWAMYARIKDVGHPNEEMLSVYRDLGVVRKDGREDNYNKTAENRDIYQLVHPGWLIVNRMKAWQGSVGISALRGTVSGHYICFKPLHNEDHRFLNYLIRSEPYASELRLLSRGVRPSQIEIDNDLLRTLPVFVPPRDQQRAIADYLDTETARIDSLIEKKQRLIAVANERRRALISHMVTGTDRAKDASRTRLRFIATINPRATMFETLSLETEVAFVPLEAVSADGLDLTQRRVLADVSAGYTKFQEGDILIPKITPTFQADRSVIAKHLPNGVGVGTTELHIVRVSQGYDARYIRYLFSCRDFLDGGEAEMIGVAGQKRVPELWLKNFPVPVLDSCEQRGIADFLDTETAHLDKTVGFTLRQILLIRERRQALITAAVTGELQVPGVAA